jgi:transposase-like protein
MKITNIQTLEQRAIRGYGILMNGSTITQLGPTTFLVPSQSKSAKYLVHKNGEDWSCECPDHQFRLVQCKHIYAVQLWLNLRKTIQPKTAKIEYPEVYECKFCGSNQITKYGKKTKQLKQRYYCKTCKKTFVSDTITRKMWFNPEVVTMTLDLYYKGVSLRGIQDHLNQIFNVQLNSPQTILNWVRKYEILIGEYVKTLKPELSGQWHTDEMKVKFGGKWRWLWNVMDKDTRYLLASNITEKRETEDARKVFAIAKEVAQGQKPEKVVTDGLHAYRDAFNKEFFTLRNPRTEHISHIRLAGDMNNNIVERLHGTKRDREKVMRGLKNEETPIIPMQDIYYNHVRPHQGLDGRTPAEKAGVGIEDQNKWLGLIKKSLETRHRPEMDNPK